MGNNSRKEIRDHRTFDTVGSLPGIAKNIMKSSIDVLEKTNYKIRLLLLDPGPQEV